MPWDIFDRLPWPIREVYCFAAYNYTPIRSVEELDHGVELDVVVARAKLRMRKRMRAEALRVYGPDHPQAAQ